MLPLYDAVRRPLVGRGLQEHPAMAFVVGRGVEPTDRDPLGSPKDLGSRRDGPGMVSVEVVHRDQGSTTQGTESHLSASSQTAA
jgi:hypothetical protein